MLQTWLKKGSVKLYDATEHLAYINSVSILLPSTWTEVTADPVSGLAYEVIRIILSASSSTCEIYDPFRWAL